MSIDGRSIMRILLTACLVLICSVSCARIPMKVSNNTLLKYETIYDEQKSIPHPLLGVWRVTFAIDEKTDIPDNAYYSVGEMVFVSIRRGQNIDFVCASYLGDFGELSDQGPAHTVNFNGATFWSFSDRLEPDNSYKGKLTGILGSKGNAEALAQGSQLRIYEYPVSFRDGAEVLTTTLLVGGPLGGSYSKENVATIFLERRR